MGRLDFSAAVLAVVLALFGGGIAQMAASWPEASHGLLIFAREQKDELIDFKLVARSYHVRAATPLEAQLRKETVIVGSRTSKHGVYMGAGVILGMHDGLLEIVTARHVIAHSYRRFVIFPQQIGRYATRVVPSKTMDLALVYVRPIPGVTYAAAPLAKTEFASGDRFVVMGHPGNKEWTASPGVAQRQLEKILLYCPTCARGDSGAGAFDVHGRLHGIVVSKDVMTTYSAVQGATRVSAFEIVPLRRVRAFIHAKRSV